MTKNKDVIIFNSGKRWVFERLLASVFYAITIYLLILFFVNNPIRFTSEYFILVLRLIASLIFVLTFAVYYSYTQDYHFNLKNNKFRIYYSVGPLGFGSWKTIGKLDYTAINFNRSLDLFEVNVWDEINNRFRITTHDTKEQAIDMAIFLADKLKIQFYKKE